MKYKIIDGAKLSRTIRNTVLALGAVAALSFGAGYLRDNYEQSHHGYNQREISAEITEMYRDVKSVDTRVVEEPEMLHLNTIEDVLGKDATIQKAVNEQPYLHSKYDELQRAIDNKQDRCFYSLVEDLDKSLNKRGRVRNGHALQREYENACRIESSLDALEGRVGIPKEEFESYQQLAETNKEAWATEPYHLRTSTSSSGRVDFQGVYNHNAFSGVEDVWERAKRHPAFPYAMTGLAFLLAYRLFRTKK